MERKEPTLSGIVPGKDDHHGSEPPSGPTGALPAQPPAPENSGPGFVAVFALILAFAGIGGSGYIAWQWNESQKALTAAQNRITELESRIDLSSNQSSETVDKINEKLEWADSEIRKLWGVSYDTNRKRIDTNAEATASLKQQFQAVEKDAAQARAAVNNLRREYETQVKALKQQLAQANEALDGMGANSDRLQSLSLDVQRLTQQMPGLRDLASRVKTNEEAIDAIDAYRRTVNRDILQLKQQLESSPATP